MRHQEDQLQKACVRWFDYQYNDIRMLLHHSPNGGYRNAVEASKFKSMGTRAGFPDLILLYPSADGTHSFLLIELKTEKGRQSDLQKDYEKLINNHTNGKYVIVRSLDQFIDTINSYLKHDRD